MLDGILYAGSFDPPTLGHLDLIERARRLAQRVVVGVAHHAGKQGLFTTEQRIELLRRATRGLQGVEVVRIDGLVVDAARRLGCAVLLRGVRGGADFDFETAMARTNAELAPGIETLLLAPSPAYAHVSSTLVRQITLAGGDAGRFVPPAVAEALKELRKQDP
ncbi:MAG: pantetheine-phosphate adenylyltransferase [Planctomycetes bacterium]|nr:pantetheine-phosphate adenylyltransferase [Planctomycetota bacterium]